MVSSPHGVQTHVKRRLSPAAIKRISDAQHKRWAKIKKAKKYSGKKTSAIAAYWSAMTPEARSAEVKRRMRKAQKNAA